MRNTFSLRATLLAATLVTPLAAQVHRHTDSARAMAGAEHAMSGRGAHDKHLSWTRLRTPTRDDSVRALALADTLRRAIATYRDTTAAVRAGYKMFAPQIKDPATYHFTSNAAALKAMFTFDPARPTSLLYRKGKAGALELIGAMYTAPARSSESKLDARVPLSIAQWHQHVNLCVPRESKARERMRSGDTTSRFGLQGDIADKAACEKANGRFMPKIFGWMLHANVFEGTGLGVWERATSHGAR